LTATTPQLGGRVAGTDGGTDVIATTRVFKAGALLLALVFGVLLVQRETAAISSYNSKQSAEALAATFFTNCKNGGGSPTIHYELGSDGEVVSVTVACKGGTFAYITCQYFQHEGYTTAVCEEILVPGQQSTSPHAPVGGGVLEDVDVTPAPVSSFPTDGTLATPEASPAPRTGVVGTARTTVVQVDDDEQP
jgi:hypothetical protein